MRNLKPKYFFITFSWSLYISTWWLSIVPVKTNHSRADISHRFRDGWFSVWNLFDKFEHFKLLNRYHVCVRSRNETRHLVTCRCLCLDFYGPWDLSYEAPGPTDNKLLKPHLVFSEFDRILQSNGMVCDILLGICHYAFDASRHVC